MPSALSFPDQKRRGLSRTWSDDQGNPLNECAPPSDGYEDSHNALMALIDAARTFLASIGHESTPQGPGRIENPVLSVATASMQSIH